MKLLTVVGARPNFVKVAPFFDAIRLYNEGAGTRDPVTNRIVHTGQHYDDRMSASFFQFLRVPEPDHNLSIGSGTHAEQVGKAMIALEGIMVEQKPDWVVVVGDVNAALAATINAKKLRQKVAHVEAGLRSNDWTMPEEINRILVDRVADLLLTTGRLADENLAREGIPASRIVPVGNIMIDTLDQNLHEAMLLSPAEVVTRAATKSSEFRSPEISRFVLVTLHRPSNVDDQDTLSGIIRALIRIARECPVVMPLHPRTRGKINMFNLWAPIRECETLHATDPLAYHEMLCMNARARVVLTDSGGVQEEATVLGTPCLTLRPNTERPETLAENGGTNQLVGNDPEQIYAAWRRVMNRPRTSFRPPLWDGRASGRILEALLKRRSDAPICVELPHHGPD